MDTILVLHGMKSKILQMMRPIGIERFGALSQQATNAVEVPGTIVDTRGVRRAMNFQAPVAPNSDTPALRGRKSLARNRAIIDMVNSKINLCGEGCIQFRPPPGSLDLDLFLSTSGHLMLPITRQLENPEKVKWSAAAKTTMDLYTSAPQVQSNQMAASANQGVHSPRSRSQRCQHPLLLRSMCLQQTGSFAIHPW